VLVAGLIVILLFNIRDPLSAARKGLAPNGCLACGIGLFLVGAVQLRGVLLRRHRQAAGRAHETAERQRQG
jgi:hypothetical protein